MRSVEQLAHARGVPGPEAFLERAHHARLDGRRRHGVHAHVRAEGERTGARETDHGVLARDVGGDVRVARHARHRRQVHDRAAAAAAQHGARAAHAEEDAAHVDGEHAVENVERIALDRRHHALDAGVVDEQVEAAELSLGARHERLEVGFDRHVGGRDQRAAARAAHAGGGRLERAAGQVREQQGAPSRASRSAVARPMPPAAPVTSATLPA